MAISCTEPICLENKDLNKEDVRGISVGHNHLLVLGAKNKVYSFGNNEFGQLGNEQEVSYWARL